MAEQHTEMAWLLCFVNVMPCGQSVLLFCGEKAVPDAAASLLSLSKQHTGKPRIAESLLLLAKPARWGPTQKELGGLRMRTRRPPHKPPRTASPQPGRGGLELLTAPPPADAASSRASTLSYQRRGGAAAPAAYQREPRSRRAQ